MGGVRNGLHFSSSIEGRRPCHDYFAAVSWRVAFADALRTRGGGLVPRNPKLFPPRTPRIRLPLVAATDEEASRRFARDTFDLHVRLATVWTCDSTLYSRLSLLQTRTLDAPDGAFDNSKPTCDVSGAMFLTSRGLFVTSEACGARLFPASRTDACEACIVQVQLSSLQTRLKSVQTRPTTLETRVMGLHRRARGTPTRNDDAASVTHDTSNAPTLRASVHCSRYKRARSPPHPPKQTSSRPVAA